MHGRLNEDILINHGTGYTLFRETPYWAQNRSNNYYYTRHEITSLLLWKVIFGETVYRARHIITITKTLGWKQYGKTNVILRSSLAFLFWLFCNFSNICLFYNSVGPCSIIVIIRLRSMSVTTGTYIHHIYTLYNTIFYNTWKGSQKCSSLSFGAGVLCFLFPGLLAGVLGHTEVNCM